MAEEKKTKKTKRPTAEKRLLQNKKKRLINKSFKSKVKTAVNAFKRSLENDLHDESQKNLDLVFSLADKGVKNNIYKKNKSNRLKSKLSLMFQNKKKIAAE